MPILMTRRRFGGALASVAVLPSLAAMRAAAQPAGYANPHLLMSVEDLMPLAAPAAGGGSTLYEAQGMALVDIRPAEAYAEGHIPGARHLDPNAVVDPGAPVSGALRPTEEIARILGDIGLDASTRVVFYDDRGGFHAARMFWLLEYLGHRDVALLNGGLTAWVAAGGPVTDAVPTVEPLPVGVSPMPRRIASADYILRHQHDAETVVVDVRPTHLHEEGRIPWAINVPWAQNLDENALYLPADALAAHFASEGVTPDRDVVIHCQQGLASAHSYVALRLLGYPRVRVYHRSWAEWGAADDLPKVTGA